MYDVLAEFYDRFQDVDYEAFADYYQRLFAAFELTPKLVLDLGCGTGNITLPLAERGYEMIGLDASAEMLGRAAEKATAAGQDILFLHQDMTAFELYGTVDAMVCALDGVNYLTEDGELEAMLKLLHYYLNPGGILIFDINTEHKLRSVLGGNVFVYDESDAYCVWSSQFSDKTKLCDFDLTFFSQNSDGSYTRQEEYQQERAYSIAEIKQKIAACGLECAGVFDHLSLTPPTPESERVFFVVRRRVSAFRMEKPE